MSANDSPQRSGFLGYDVFKLIVALVLAVILVLLLLRACSGASGQASATAQPAAAQTQPSIQSGAAIQASAAPSITSPKDGDSLSGSSVTLQGTGQPGSSIRVLDSGKTVSDATIGSDGKWSAQVAVTAGQHTFVAASADGSQKSAPVVVTVGSGLAITSPKDGDTVDGPSVSLQGTGPAGGAIQILDGDQVVSTVTAGGDGKWSAQVTVTPGQHTFAAASADGSQKSDPVHVTVGPAPATATPSPIPPTATPAVASGGCGPNGAVVSGFLKDKQHYVVGSCDTLSGIAVFLNVSVETLLASNPQITNPNVVVPGQIVNVPPK